MARHGLALLLVLMALPAGAQQAPASTESAPSRADVLRGEYGRYRANNDLLHYALDIRVDPARRTVTGSNTIKFRMLADDTRVQLDLQPAMTIESVRLDATTLRVTRDGRAFYVDFPSTLRAGQTYAIEVRYSGAPQQQGRFGCLVFGADTSGRPWIYTACEDEGASGWWPNKDQWHDEPDEGIRMGVAVPDGLMDVSNGKFLGRTSLGDGFNRWDWQVSYPINSYNVALNIGSYVQFSERLGDMPLDYFVLPENLERARAQFAQAKPMLEIYERLFGEYPFRSDGFKLIEVPYAGMEHQSAVAYGNRFSNGYLERDWTGVGISPRFDFIIIHESAHEWFGNAVSAADVSDMWLQEGWTTYLELLYVEARWGRDAGTRYINGLRPKVLNRDPIITQRGIHRVPSQDMYFKGALFLHTLRSVVDDDAKWGQVQRGFYQQFKYRNILTEDMVRYFNAELGMDLTPIFDQYLRRAALPTLELVFQPDGMLAYRWKADERAFAMPVRAGAPGALQILRPSTSWQVMPAPASKDAYQVATDLYYINVSKQ